jgi:hypothetical protein
MTVTTEEAERLAELLAAYDLPSTGFAVRSLAAERDARQARVAELEGALDAASRVLHKAGEQFTSYADQHAAKGTADGDLKAATNQQWAQRCFNAHDAALEGKK